MTTPPPTILLLGQDAALGYLLARFAEHSGYQCQVRANPVSSHEVSTLRPAVVIFLSLEWLAHDPGGVAELARLEAPILVCSAAAEEAQAREMGADYCLIHPLTYTAFQSALLAVTVAPRH